MGPNDKEEDNFNLDVARSVCSFDCLDEHYNDEEEAIAKSFVLIDNIKDEN
jgi:hypothetical protein